MIARGSMVVLKGHHLTPMVVVSTFGSDRGDLSPPGTPRAPDDMARVTWLDTFGVPHSETYPLELLEEIDG